MQIFERHLLAVCSVAFSVFVTPVLADTASTENEPYKAPTAIQAKPERQSGSHRQAARRQTAVPASSAWAYAPEGESSRAPRPQDSRPAASMGAGWASSDLIAEARRYMGTNPTRRRSLWCGAFMNLVLERTGHARGKSDLAKSFASYGTRVSGPQVGAIAVMSRGPTGGHVGVVTGIDPSGNPIVISGNHEGRVAEVPYPRGRIFAYVMPSGSAAGEVKQAGNTGSSITQEN